MATTTVTFGGISISSVDGSTWKLQSLQGWYGGAPVRPVLVERPTADGYFSPGTVYRNGRPITVSGFVRAPDATSAMALWAQFAGLSSDGNSITMTVADASGTKMSEVWLAVEPEIYPVTATLAQFTVQFVAADPVKYGPAAVGLSATLPTQGGGLQYNLGTGATGVLTYGANGYLGRITIDNSLGTAESSPVLNVTGGLPGGFFLNIMETADVLTYPRIVALGDTVQINNRTGRVNINGQGDVTAYLTSADFFSVPAGAIRTVQFNSISGTPTGTPTLTVTFSPGYW